MYTDPLLCVGNPIAIIIWMQELNYPFKPSFLNLFVIKSSWCWTDFAMHRGLFQLFETEILQHIVFNRSSAWSSFFYNSSYFNITHHLFLIFISDVLVFVWVFYNMRVSVQQGLLSGDVCAMSGKSGRGWGSSEIHPDLFQPALLW